jgi:hypothetical protein
MSQAASPDVRTFIFGELSAEEQAKFLEFMIKNNVQFSYDGQDQMYIATVKIVNKAKQGAATQQREQEQQSAGYHSARGQSAKEQDSFGEESKEGEESQGFDQYQAAQ